MFVLNPHLLKGESSNSKLLIIGDAQASEGGERRTSQSS
jgi:hypothetical protein